MSKFALVQSGTVENVIEADQAHIDTIKSQYQYVVNVDNIQAGPGDSYDGTTFTHPTPPTPPPIRVISKEDFRNRFTQAEKQAIYKAKSSDVEIEIWLDDIAAASDIDLNNPDIKAGLDSMVKAGLITQARETEILS